MDKIPSKYHQIPSTSKYHHMNFRTQTFSLYQGHLFVRSDVHIVPSIHFHKKHIFLFSSGTNLLNFVSTIVKSGKIALLIVYNREAAAASAIPIEQVSISWFPWNQVAKIYIFIITCTKFSWKARYAVLQSIKNYFKISQPLDHSVIIFLSHGL